MSWGQHTSEGASAEPSCHGKVRCPLQRVPTCSQSSTPRSAKWPPSSRPAAPTATRGNGSGANSRGMLELMIRARQQNEAAFTREDLRANTAIFFLAGHDTTVRSCPLFFFFHAFASLLSIFAIGPVCPSLSSQHVSHRHEGLRLSTLLWGGGHMVAPTDASLSATTGYRADLAPATCCSDPAS
jgi:hypothetical protein